MNKAQAQALLDSELLKELLSPYAHSGDNYVGALLTDILKALIAKIEDNERLTAAMSRVRAAVELAEPVSDELLVAARGRFSLRETAKRYGVGVGRVRGAWQRATLKESARSRAKGQDDG